MPQTKTISINGKEITVKELRVKDMLEIIEKAGKSKKDVTIAGFKSLVEQNMTLACDASIDDLKEMAPSEIKQIVDAFKEVNSVFFETAQALGLGGITKELKESLKSDFMKIYADSLKQVTAMSLDTGSASL